MTDLLSARIDSALPFQVHKLGVRGRVVRLTAAAGPMLGTERYPPAVAGLLGGSLALVALLASTLKCDVVFSLKIQGDGPISLMVANATSDGNLRAYTKFNEHGLNNALAQTDGMSPHLAGTGHMAFTVDQGPDTGRYQGITALDGATLAACASSYFRD